VRYAATSWCRPDLWSCLCVLLSTMSFCATSRNHDLHQRLSSPSPFSVPYERDHIYYFLCCAVQVLHGLCLFLPFLRHIFVHHPAILRASARPPLDAFLECDTPHTDISLVLYVIGKPAGSASPAPSRRSCVHIVKTNIFGATTNKKSYHSTRQLSQYWPF